MSSLITNYFTSKPKPPNSRKRKLETDPSMASTSNNSNDDTKNATPPSSEQNEKSAERDTKKRKLSPENSEIITETESKAQSEADSESDADLEEETKPIVISNTNVHQNDENKDPTVTTPEIKKYSECHLLLHESWATQLRSEFSKPYFIALLSKLDKEQKSGAQIFPPLTFVFRAFELCPWEELKVVLLGQDPYHDNNQAEGLCFSVPREVKVPSSLRNMMKEATDDIGFVHPGHGSLVSWAKQGVLLLNTVLTVQAHKANSHKKFGWQQFTDRVIQCISDKHDGVVFILWGGQAKAKKKMINGQKHRIVESAHPSGLSAHRGFFGSKPYSKCNAFLKELGKEPVDWHIATE